MTFSGLVALQLVLIFTHSPWRDEEQALLIAQQPIPLLFGLLHYEGHPALWYLMLKAGAIFTHSPVILPIVQSVTSIGILSVIWRSSPFTWPVKLLISTGYFVIFEYGVIARSYGLGVLLFFAFVAIRRSPWAWLLLALLANVAVHTALLAGACVVWLALDRRWSWRGAMIVVVGGLVAVATAWPAADVVHAEPLHEDLVAKFLVALSWSSLSILPAWPIDPSPGWYTRTPVQPSLLLGVLPLVLGALALRRDPRHVMLFVGFYAALIAVSVFVYTSYPRHFGLAAVLFIGLLWTQREAGQRISHAAWIWLTVMAAGGVWFASSALVQPFSNAKHLGAWIRSEHLEDEAWASMRGFHGINLAAEVGRPSYNLQKGCRDTYQRWNYNPEAPMTDTELRTRIEVFRAAANGGYVLSDRASLPVNGSTNIKTFAGGMFGQPLYVHHLRPAGSQIRSLPDCN